VNVVIVGTFWFPFGTASAARVRNLALGLRECGARVHMISLAPFPRANGLIGSNGHGEYQGVSYECASPTVAPIDGWRDEDRTLPRLRNGLIDKVRWFAGLYGATPFAWQRLRRRITRGECDLVVAYERSALRATPLVRLCRARGVTSVLDVTEISEHLGSRLSPLYWDSRVGTRSTPRLFDGLTVISGGLEARYRAEGYAQVLVIPAIEAWPAVEPPPPTRHRRFHLTYVGALQPRDAPELLLESVRLLAERGCPVVLDVVGHYEGTARGAQLARRCAEDPLLRSAVRFLGSLSDRAMTQRLAGSDGLVLTRRDAPTEEMSFPTRLVEYLRHGRPVFISDVGDVSRYLRDRQEAVLLHPRDPALVADAIGEVVGRPDRGAQLGLSGQQAGARAFDRRTHAARLLDFAAGLRERRAAS
jgi:glycosyltransferase involved in cell wall biosynthesis